MPEIGFRGFTAGSLVALSVAQGAASAGNSVAGWGASVASIDIDPRTAGTNVAPAAVWLRAVAPAGFTLSDPPPGTAYDPAFHEITYIWRVRGAPLAPFTAPENMVTGWNDPNTAYGAEVAFSFPEPGTYIVDLWCIDRSGATAAAETTITVADPADVYPGGQTLCLALDGDVTDAPAGSQQFASVANLNGAISNLSAPARVLFKRGEVYNDLALSNNAFVQYWGAWGTGADPIVRPPRDGRLATLSGMTQFTATELDFRGGWDAATETGSPDDHAFFPRNNGQACWYHYHGCRFSGFEIFEPTPGSPTVTSGACIFSDTVITNWRDYGIYTNGRAEERFLAVLGCRVAQNPDALNGGTKNGLYNNHGPIRLANITNVYIAQSDLFSRNGWSPLSPDTADQPCLRLNATPEAPGNRASLDRVVCEGGFFQIALETQNTSTPERDANYVLDKVLCISTAKSIGRFISLRIGGTTMRNLIGLMPDVPAYHGNSWVAGVNMGEGAAEPANLASPVALYNASFANLRNTANDPGHIWPDIAGADFFTTTTIENTLAFAPGIDTPVEPGAAIDIVTAMPGITPRYKGVRFNFGHEDGTLTSAVSPGQSFSLPYPAGTDQVYWQAIEATDTRHMIRGIGDTLLAEKGDFTIAFGPSEVTITNISGRVWEAGSNWKLRLDRKSLIPPMDTAYASPPTLPLPRPLAGSAEIGSGDLGLSAYDDFMGAVRPPAGDTRGALLPE